MVLAGWLIGGRMKAYTANTRHGPTSDTAAETVGSGSGLAIRELKRGYRESLNRAKAHRKMAAAQPTVERAEIYREQVRFETAKALGYLRQKKAIQKLELELEADEDVA